ncbi:MAG: hypothetical protein M1823_003498 [Watsoniomyces obsoletus]|nr:MAG: hypothetical protein M1823_003498 [Watsoniomyces obsoletus]
MGNVASKLFPNASTQAIEHVPPHQKKRDIVRKTVLSDLNKDEGVRVLIAEGAEFIRAALWELEKELDQSDSAEVESDRDPQGKGNRGGPDGVRRTKKKRRGGRRRKNKRGRPKNLPWPGPDDPEGPDDGSRGGGGGYEPRYPSNRPDGPIFPIKPEKHMRFRHPLNSYIPGAPRTVYSQPHDHRHPRTSRPRPHNPTRASYFPDAMEGSSEEETDTEPSRTMTSMIDANSSVTTPDDTFIAEMGPGTRDHRRRGSKPNRRHEDFRDRRTRFASGETRRRPPKEGFAYEPMPPDEEWDSGSVLSSPVTSHVAQEWPPPRHGRHAAGPSMGMRGGRGRGRGRRRDVSMMSGGLPGVMPEPRENRYPARTRTRPVRPPRPGEGFPGGAEVEADGYHFGYGDGGHPFHEGMMGPGVALGDHLQRRGGSRRSRGGRGGSRLGRKSRENARSSSA